MMIPTPFLFTYIVRKLYGQERITTKLAYTTRLPYQLESPWRLPVVQQTRDTDDLLNTTFIDTFRLNY